jgi:SAM-dependent methyltransferase
VSATYDRIGIGYDQLRKPDPRLAAVIGEALGDVRTVVNVGAGAGSYEPTAKQVVAVEPAAVMLTQHQEARRVQATAEALPFPDKAFDAAMAIMTIHHWTDLDAGLAEMHRVAQRQVIFTWDKQHDEELWIVAEYVPEIRVMEHARFPCLDSVVNALGGAAIREFPIPTTSPTAISQRSGDVPTPTWTLPSGRPARRSRRFPTRSSSRRCAASKRTLPPCLGASASGPPRTQHGRLRLPTRRQHLTHASSRDSQPRGADADTNHGIIRWCGPSSTSPMQ